MASLGVVVVTVLLFGVVVASLSPSTEAFTLNVNNTHCAHKSGVQIPKTVPSGHPFHDHHGEDLRGNCSGITLLPTDYAHYAITYPYMGPVTYGELYLRSNGVNWVDGSVCLNDTPGQSSGWKCGSQRSWRLENWEHFPGNLGLSNQHAGPGPSGGYVDLGFSSSGGPCPCNDVQAPNLFYLIRYSGPLSSLGYIEDPTHLLNPNQYEAMDNFTTWRVHDPAGDDILVIGGIPIQVIPGTLLTLTAHGIEIEYLASTKGGNEWRIASDDDRVYVWNDTAGKWHIKHLDYED